MVMTLDLQRVSFRNIIHNINFPIEMNNFVDPIIHMFPRKEEVKNRLIYKLLSDYKSVYYVNIPDILAMDGDVTGSVVSTFQKN